MATAKPKGPTAEEIRARVEQARAGIDPRDTTNPTGAALDDVLAYIDGAPESSTDTPTTEQV